MPWQQLMLRLPAAELPQAEALLRLAGAESLSLSDAGDVALLEPGPGETPLWPYVELRSLFAVDADLARVRALLATAVCVDTYSVERLADDDWIDAWRQRIRPREFGNGLWVLPADGEAPQDARYCLRLGMGLAFGTGQHATTTLCLEWLAEQSLADRRVLDFGCGSGILALAALLKGARCAWATDTDPQALTATAENARLNRLDASLWIGPPADLPPVAADVVLANIVAGTLIAAAPRLAAAARANAALVLSGLLVEQADAVEAAYARDFTDFERREREGWLCVVARRRSGGESVE